MRADRRPPSADARPAAARPLRGQVVTAAAICPSIGRPAGNISFMDRLETIAFNALPAALWPDVSANVYHHANNQIETGSGGPYAYDLYFCCTANVHQVS
eukprot:SAG11_NODE_162_length_13962_cov_19.035562_7_plen_100_part_00